jgi:hypothetical protein
MEQLHRCARAVAVRRRVDARHAADAEQHVELPLVAKNGADARACALRERLKRVRCGGGDDRRDHCFVLRGAA